MLKFKSICEKKDKYLGFEKELGVSICLFIYLLREKVVFYGVFLCGMRWDLLNQAGKRIFVFIVFIV